MAEMPDKEIILFPKRWPGIIIRRGKENASKMWMNAGQSSCLRKKKRRGNGNQKSEIRSLKERVV